jgi:hypothetical protein
VGKYTFKVKEGHESFYLMIDAVEKFNSYPFPSRMTSYKTRVVRFLEDYPEYNMVPRSILRGSNQFGAPITDDHSGFRLKNGHLWVRRLEDIYFTEPARLFSLRRLQLSRANGGEITFHAGAKRGEVPDVKNSKFNVSNLQEYKKSDHVMDYLYVNNEFDGDSDATWRRYAILKYIENHPYVSRQELMEMGIISNKDWDLVVDFHEGMQAWNRANPKPKECNILSIGPSGQYVKRLKKEKRMPETIDSEDVDKGNLKGQSYDGEMYRAVHGNYSGFFD